jgi:hypothetical protein
VRVRASDDVPVVGNTTGLERVSIELTRRCAKGCSFCYNGSGPGGDTRWSPEEVVSFVNDCARNGVRAVSFGGGEPLEYEGLFAVLASLRGTLFRSLTSNGLLLDGKLEELVAAAPDKVHLSIHFPDRAVEVARVIRQVDGLQAAGVRAGVNLLVRRSGLAAAAATAERLRASGIGNDRIAYLPMRGADTPTPGEMSVVAGRAPFQSMSCLMACRASPRFCSVGWDRTVAWCSYTTERRPLQELTHAGLCNALDGLGLRFCGGAPEPVAR